MLIIRNIWYHLPLCNGNYDSLGRLLRWDNRSILYWILTTHKEKRSRYLKLLESDKHETLPVHYRLRNHNEVKQFIRVVQEDDITV
jgi:hypothetical protein